MFLAKFVRESFFGRCIYHLSGRKVFNYDEEQSDYVIPSKYLGKSEAGIDSSSCDAPTTDGASSHSSESTKSEHIMVEFEGDNDPENPKNWPLGYKILFIAQIMILTTFVYMASAIYTPGEEQIMKDMGVGTVVATLPLTLFVFGYGIGPMIFSPLSENARFGRTSIYIITLFIFFILQIPTALVKNIAGLCVLRFIAGIFASPCLATGGASIGDVMTLPYMPVGISFWSISAVCAPSCGPLFGAILTVKANYHWTFWFVCITSGASFLVLGWLLPESYDKTILYRKANRLRALTGNDTITSEGHIENSKFSTHEMLIETLWRPFEVIIFEPVVLLINLYIGMVYSIMYLWFEAFPIVFLEVKGFTVIEMGVAYLCILVGILVAAAFYIPWIYSKFTKKMLKNEEVAPEMFIPIAIAGSIIMPIGIFIFGWTAAKDLHWIGPLIGAAVFAAGSFLIFQTLFNYLSMSFWRYLASVFAGNDLFRSMMAGAFPLFGRPLFNNLSTNRFQVGWGSSLLGFICVGMIAIPVLFYLNGPKLRARSKYAGAG